MTKQHHCQHKEHRIVLSLAGMLPCMQGTCCGHSSLLAHHCYFHVCGHGDSQCAVGAEPPHLTVTSAVWRRTAAGFASAVQYAEKVLGIRSNDSSTNGSSAAAGGGGGGGGRGRGNRGARDGGADARGRARGRGRGRDITRQLYEHQHEQQSVWKQQQEQRQQEMFNQRAAAMSALPSQAPAAPAVEMSAYYYSPEDDYSSSTSSYPSRAAQMYMNFGGYDNTSQTASRGRGKIGVGNRGRSYRSNNR